MMAQDLEEDLPDGMNVENCDYMITNCVKDREQESERPLTKQYQCRIPVYQSETANELASII